jgi:hypothetical protein
MSQFDRSARKASSAEAMKRAWQRTLGSSLSDSSANAFVRHYREMTKGKKQRGGAAYALSGASTEYVMGPGAAGMSPIPYGHFTDDVTSNPSLLRQVGGPAEIPEIAQNVDCGVDRYPTMTEARMAQVGAGRNLYTRSRMNRKASRKASRKNRKNSRKNRASRKHRASRKQRGGNLLVALNPMNWLNPLGAPTVSSGSMDPVPGSHGWVPQSHGVNAIPSIAGLNQYTTVPPVPTSAAWNAIQTPRV